METLWVVLQHPFTWGLGLGLLVAGFLWKMGLDARSGLKRENKRLASELTELQKHLNTHLKISASGNDQLQKDLATLKEQNENLRVSVATLQQKPGRAEMRHLHIIEGAVRRMREQAPGFAATWEQAVRLSTADEEAAESGLTKLIRKVLPGSDTVSARSDESRPASLLRDQNPT